MTQATDEAGQEQGLGEQASVKVQDAASAAQEKASELRAQGSARLRDQFDQRSNQAGSQMRSLAEALRRSGNEVSNDGSTGVSQLTGQAADRIERLGRYLEQKNGDEVTRDVETFARSRPWMLAGLGMLAGVAVARFVKASSEERYSDYRRTSQQWPTRSGGDATSSDGADIRRRGSIDQPVGEMSRMPAALSDEGLARDPYAGKR